VPTVQSLLANCAIESVDARIILSHLCSTHLGWPRTYLITHNTNELPTALIEHWQELLQKRLLGLPVAYLIGKKNFHDIELQVNAHVLIPRPETELLVEFAISHIESIFNSPNSVFTPLSPMRCLDLGTGSGAIILALASYFKKIPDVFPCLNFFASDISLQAIDLAKLNSKNLDLHKNITFFKSNWFSNFPNHLSFDLVLSNPPYIASDDTHLSHGDLRFEPKLALTDGFDGLNAYRLILKSLSRYLNSGAIVVFEHGFEQAVAIQCLLQDHDFIGVLTKKDFSGSNRITFAQSK
jgi:release factor glutamine methyltransferase